MMGKFPPPGSDSDLPSFDHPAQVVIADLDHTTKLKVLAEWEHDLRRMLSTSDENMPGTRPGETGEMLKAVTDALIALGGAGGDAPGVPTSDGSKSRVKTEAG